MKPCTSRLTCTFAILVLGISAAPGCSDSSGESRYTNVWGKVTYNGQPVTDGVIFFAPTDVTKTTWGSSPLTRNGRYWLSVFPYDSRLEPGSHTICIKPTSHEVAATNAPRLDLEAGNSKHKTEPQALPSIPDILLPQRFSDYKTSGLQVYLDGQLQQIDLELKD
jgi:hypothetical protein